MNEQRGIRARLGIVLLNLVGPGLGLLRLGRWRSAGALYVLSIAPIGVLDFGPPLPFGIFVTLVATALASFLAACWLSWRLSGSRLRALDWYNSWYVMVGACAAAILISFLVSDQHRLAYRSFYTPTDSMAPTFEKNDRFFAYTHAPKHLGRGDLVLVKAPDGTPYIKRIAALPGDKIAMANGVVVLDGLAIPQHILRKVFVNDEAGRGLASLEGEQFPGEARSHQIYDMGPSAVDEMAEQTVQPGHVFVLGDNRDNSADSRLPRDVGGLEQVPITDIEGYPLYFSWGSSKPIGEPVS